MTPSELIAEHVELADIATRQITVHMEIAKMLATFYSLPLQGKAPEKPATLNDLKALLAKGGVRVTDASAKLRVDRKQIEEWMLAAPEIKPYGRGWIKLDEEQGTLPTGADAMSRAMQGLYGDKGPKRPEPAKYPSVDGLIFGDRYGNGSPSDLVWDGAKWCKPEDQKLEAV